jgi:hypothetical protein
MASSMQAKTLLVIDPLVLHVTKVGTLTPLNVHSGPHGKIFPLPFICILSITTLSTSSASHDKGLYPVTSVILSFPAAIMIAHMMGLPVPAIFGWCFHQLHQQK